MNKNRGSLAHYGVPGMKWGKGKKGSKTLTRDQQVKAKRATASKGRRTLSDKSLNKKIERLQAEKKLKDLTDADIAPGKSVVKRILSASGEKAAKTIVSGAILLAVKTAVSGKFDLEDAAKYLAPKPKSK